MQSPMVLMLFLLARKYNLHQYLLTDTKYQRSFILESSIFWDIMPCSLLFLFQIVCLLPTPPTSLPILLGSMHAHTTFFSSCSHICTGTLKVQTQSLFFCLLLGLPWFFDRANANRWVGFQGPFYFTVIPWFCKPCALSAACFMLFLACLTLQP
jgi:hypothetical protein